MNLRTPTRYLGWMLRDAVIRPGLTCLAISALFTFILTRLPGDITRPSAHEYLVRTVGQMAWLVVLVATAGLVSWDRASGYYRSLFSQPVNPGLYYLQRWLVGALAVAAMAPLTGLFILLASGFFPWSGPLLERLLLEYLLLGGLTFALSTVVRTDWLIAFLVSILQSVLYSLEQSGAPLSGFTRALTRGLPPFEIGSVGMGAVSYPTPGELTHALLYGAGLVAIALLVLRFRPLGSGGRA